jgi:hypothetical protein
MVDHVMENSKCRFSAKVAVVLYVVAMAAVIVGVDFMFFRNRFWERLAVSGKDSETVINALIKHARKLPEELYKSLTWDRGPEMAQHRRFTLATDIQVYFCDPQNPWQRGSNENTTDYCDSISPGKPTCRATRRPSSTPW